MTHNVPTDRVLSTLNQDGTRNFLHPKLAHGRFLKRRRVVAFVLIAVFVLLPRIRIHGRPGLLIDLVSREIVAFGAVFRPSDGFMLALLGFTIAIGVFLATAMYGRVWCGWGCPQTVYLEQVFRPIERWLEGPRGQKKTPLRRVVKLVIFAALAFALANVFLAYFVGTDRLEKWVFHSPAEHKLGFGVVMFVSALMMFDFTWFREQMCIVACPYGRLQSVLLDEQSLIIGYDAKRGEPRTQPKKKLPVVQGGDCVDCSACVSVCPTGIDIRDGLQMECIGCAQCIDACDTVMSKLGRKPGLIRYTSKAELAGKPRRTLRVRTIVYPALIAVGAVALGWQVSHKPTTEVWIQRIEGPSFVELPDGRISAQVRIKLENESDAQREYAFALVDVPRAELRSPMAKWPVPARKSLDVPLFVDLPRDAFVHGENKVQIRITDDSGFDKVVTPTLLGPDNGGRK